VKIVILSPAAVGSRSGNSVTATRYSRMLAALGYRVEVRSSAGAAPDADLLVALHARKSARAVLAFARTHPGRPIVVVLTGTDVYRDLQRSRLALRALKAAGAIVALQPLAIERLPPDLRSKATVVRQSAEVPRSARRPARKPGTVRFCVLGHVRREKDPLRAAYALRWMALQPRVEVVQAGGILDPSFAPRIAQEQVRSPRYRYLGELSRPAALKLLSRCDALIISSRLEGGANVASEAIALGIPAIASDIDGNRGIFGKRYAGYFATGSARDLARVMTQFASDASFASRLRDQIARLRSIVDPSLEAGALGALVRKLLRARSRQ
jgi:putative glycosyltransferase (TIGR04348 family)